MPNWTDCFLDVKGDDTQVKKFDEKFHGRCPLYNGKEADEITFSFSGIVPVPKEVLDAPFSPQYVQGNTIEQTRQQVCGYNWQIANWGVKWDVTMLETMYEEGFSNYHFQTPWSYPLAWLVQASRMFPELKFELEAYEEGDFFNHKVKVVGGKVLSVEDIQNPYIDVNVIEEDDEAGE